MKSVPVSGSMGHLVKPAFAIAFGENSAGYVKFLSLPTAMPPKELLIEKNCGRLTLSDHDCKTYTAIPTLQQAADELFMKSCKSLGFPMTSSLDLTSFVFSFTENTFFEPRVRLAHLFVINSV